jgi:hypothetical protein
MYLVRATEFTLFSARAPVSSALLQIWALAVLVISVLLTCLGDTLFTVFGSDLNSEVDGRCRFQIKRMRKRRNPSSSLVVLYYHGSNEPLNRFIDSLLFGRMSLPKGIIHAGTVVVVAADDTGY